MECHAVIGEPRIAIAQPAMHWTAAESTAELLSLLEQAAMQGARLCVFPELALTGFHRRIAEAARPEIIAPLVQHVRTTCARRGVWASVGAPTFDAGPAIFNSQLLIDAQGEVVATVEKQGLTAPEATFFARGRAGTRTVAPMLGRRCSTMLCREVEDHDEICSELRRRRRRPDLILWPGLMAPADGKELQDPPEHVQQAGRLARSLGAWVVQSNWPEQLNYPERSWLCGRSVVLDPSGQVVLALPSNDAGLAVFALGESTFDWHPTRLVDQRAA